MQVADFRVLSHNWVASRKRIDAQLSSIAKACGYVGAVGAVGAADIIVIHGVPRHHAKAIAKADWLKDYYLSKERRKVTESRPGGGGRITLVYSKYPLSSQEWFSKSDGKGFTHVVEVSIPINAWQHSHSPLALLEEYGLTYDQVATFTIVIADDNIQDLMHAFTPASVQNSVLFVMPSAIRPQLVHKWRTVECTANTIALLSCIDEDDERDVIVDIDAILANVAASVLAHKEAVEVAHEPDKL